ncbi:hypothetical protein [Chromobacterium haemolyticum]|uniref:hypothetical protein n=1 Tax=Chromobacterium haemolyticum TaxID=394935 RepID=UPI0017461A35|nr:hypothetical protein [Chromobacterium haemolyticum]QOD81904.1 hypothetical protein IEZ30_18725 [Chromobacterium haemolyticum]
MAKPKCSEDDFIRLWGELGGAASLSRHLSCSERAVHERRRAIEARRGIKLSVGPAAAAAPQVDQPDPNDLELRALRAQVAAARQDQLDAEYVKRKIVGLSRSVIDPPDWLVPRRGGGAGERGVPTLFASDWHWAEVVDPRQINGVNEYSLPIAHRRARRMVEKTIHLLRNEFAGARYPGIVFALGGDMVSGDIHEELQATNEIEIMPTVVDLIGVLAWCVRTLADEFGQVFVPCVTGNHGRNTKKIRAKGRNFTSFDWLTYAMLAKQFEDDPRVAFLIPDGPDAYWKVYNTRYMLTHGDEFRGGDGMIGALGPIVRGDHRKRSRATQVDMSYDVLLVGHFHQLIQLQRLIVNGSLKGYDEFAWRCGFPYERARQALWITHPEQGITFSMPVNVDDDSARPGLAAAEWTSWPKAG